MTAAYMTRAIWLTFFGEYRGHGTPARVAQGHDRPAVDPRCRRHRARLRQPARPTSRSATSPTYTTALRALRRADLRLPDDRPRRVQLGAGRWCRRSLAVLGIFLAYQYYWPRQEPAHGLTERSRRSALGLHGAREQVLPRPPLHRHHRRRRQGPDRPGVYWFNQNVIDGVVNGVGDGPGAAGRRASTARRPGRRRRRRQRLRRRRRGVAARSCATSRPARSSSTPPSSSPAAAVLAGIFVFVV